MVVALRSLFAYKEKPNEVAAKAQLTGKRKIVFSKPLLIS